MQHVWHYMHKYNPFSCTIRIDMNLNKTWVDIANCIQKVVKEVGLSPNNSKTKERQSTMLPYIRWTFHAFRLQTADHKNVVAKIFRLCQQVIYQACSQQSSTAEECLDENSTTAGTNWNAAQNASHTLSRDLRRLLSCSIYQLLYAVFLHRVYCLFHLLQDILDRDVPNSRPFELPIAKVVCVQCMACSSSCASLI